MRWIASLEWKSFCIITNDSKSRLEYAFALINKAKIYNIEVANEDPVIPRIADETLEEFSERVKHKAEEIWKANVRIVFLFLLDSEIQVILEHLIDLGAEIGDLIIIGFDELSRYEFNGLPMDDAEDWQKMFIGSISV
jgi:hypothetical protein